MFSDPKFVYRIESSGNPDDTTFALDRWELLSKLSFSLWGLAPDSALIDRVADDNIEDDENLQKLATDMLDDPRAHKRFADFHAMWLGYRNFQTDSTLSQAMMNESEALIKKVLFEDNRPWSDVFVSDQTFVTTELAEHYNIALPENEAGDWVAYGDSGRKGILSHATYLSVGTKFGRTSPIFRGIEFMDRVLCRPLPQPSSEVLGKIAEKEALVHEQLGDNPCNADVVKAHTLGADGEPDQNCSSCHDFIDGIGVGLEAYGVLGEFRTHEADKLDDAGDPRCKVEAQGGLPGFGDFTGPGELATLITDTDEFESCMMKRLLSFAAGRNNRSDDHQRANGLISIYHASDKKFKALILNIVTQDSFKKRTTEEIE